jgi:lipopolysaccharide biosynthesis glycosyltransferase
MTRQSVLEPIVVACASDDFYAMPLAVTALSALSNLAPERQMILFVLDAGISQSNKRKIRQSLNSSRVDVRWIKPASKMIEAVSLKCKNNYPLANYYRLLLPEIIPAEYKKAIYLDTDVVVLSDLEKLWSIDVGDNYMLAASDPCNQALYRARHLQHLDLEIMGIDPSYKYINAGVLVLNLEKWRAKAGANQIIDFIANHPELPFPDQDAMSIAFAGQWGEIDPRWNQIHAFHEMDWKEAGYLSQAQFSEVVNHPYIIHYTSRPKPWVRGCSHPQKDIFVEYLDRTAWKGWRDNYFSYGLTLLRRIFRRFSRTVKKLLQGLQAPQVKHL